jgi:hypothetical protein
VNGAQIGNTYGGEAIDNYGQKGNQPMAIRGGGGARATSGNGIDNFKSRGGSASGPGMDRDDGRVPADKMPKHVPAEATDWPEDIGKPKPKGVSRDQSYTSSQTPGGPGSRAQVQPGMHNESQVIPALKNKAPKDFNKAGIDDDPLGDPVGDDNGISLQNAEEIRLADSSKAQPLIPYLSEMLVKGIFSKNWNIRDQAVKVMSQEIVKGGKSEM